MKYVGKISSEIKKLQTLSKMLPIYGKKMMPGGYDLNPFLIKDMH